MRERTSVSDRPTTQGESTFEAFFEAEHERLFRALYVVTGSAEEASDVMQDAFAAVWERWDRVGTMDDPTGYLYRTAMNRFRSLLRRATLATARLVTGDPPRDAIEDVDERDLVGRALAGLSPRQRVAVVLIDLLGFGSEEAGRILGIKPSTARALASQGRAAIREKLEQDGE